MIYNLVYFKDMNIRPVKKADLPSCEDLCNSPELFYPNGGHFTVDHLKCLLSNKYFLVAEVSEKVVGLIFGEKLKAGGSIVWVIVVDKRFRGQGVGRKLLQKFEENAKADGCSWTVLYASTKDKKTLEFYKKQRYDIGQKYIECAKDW